MTHILFFVAAFAVTTVAQEPMTDDEYDAAMKEIRLTLGDTRGHVDARYWPELETEVGRLQVFFEQIELFWNARGVDGATGFAQEALKALESLSTAANQEDQPAARDALKSLQGSCQSCHEEFREETDNGYRIKP